MTLRWTMVQPKRSELDLYALAEVAVTSTDEPQHPGLTDCPFDSKDVQTAELVVVTELGTGATWVLKNRHGRMGRVHGTPESL